MHYIVIYSNFLSATSITVEHKSYYFEEEFDPKDWDGILEKDGIGLHQVQYILESQSPIKDLEWC